MRARRTRRPASTPADSPPPSPTKRRLPIATVGLGTVALAVVASAVWFVILGFQCSGSDASEGSDTGICAGDREHLFGWLFPAVAVLAPLLGTFFSLYDARWRWVVAGCAASVAATIAALLAFRTAF